MVCESDCQHMLWNPLNITVQKNLISEAKRISKLVLEDVVSANLNFQQKLQNMTGDTTIKDPQSLDDVANMSDDEVVKYFFDQLPKSGKTLNPDVQTSLADRVTKIRQAQTQNEATINIVAQRLKVISEFAKKNS